MPVHSVLILSALLTRGVHGFCGLMPPETPFSLETGLKQVLNFLRCRYWSYQRQFDESSRSRFPTFGRSLGSHEPAAGSIDDFGIAAHGLQKQTRRVQVPNS